MDAFWGWCWERYGRWYSWLVFVALWSTLLPVFGAACWVVLRIEDADAYGVAAVSTAVLWAAGAAITALPGTSSSWGHVEGWAAGDRSSAPVALASTYDYGRRCLRRLLVAYPASGAAVLAAAGWIADASASRSAGYGVSGALFGASIGLLGYHGYIEALFRPVRAGIAAGTDLGDDLPRARPDFATWSTVTLLAAIYVFAFSGYIFALAFDVDDVMLLAVVTGLGLMVAFGIPISLLTAFGPSLRPLRELEAGTRRIADGDYTQRIPVVQDDDLGVLAASFNRMQAGLAQRERLQAAFGSYVDSGLAERLLAQGDHLFSGDRVEVTVMFVDIRDFTPFAEANTAEDTVAHLNTLFEVVIDAVDDLNGHINKFLGDGAMVVFGAPERFSDHADRAVACAGTIQREVDRRFAGAVRLGIGINTGTVIAGTIGSPKKLEFTLIGDAVNVAARVEQLTKATGDATLLTRSTRDALTATPDGLADRGEHPLKGKTEPVVVHALDHRRANL